MYFVVLCIVLVQHTSGTYVCNTESECDELAGNKVCDAKCNNLNCRYDSGDCLLERKPWRNCAHETSCKDRFHNETCDDVCNNEACLYDLFKCKHLNLSGDCLTNCTNKWGDGVCDMGCNNVLCGYDGNDCNNNGTIIPGSMIIYYKSSSDAGRFIGFSYSLATRSIVSLKYGKNVPETEFLENSVIRTAYTVHNVPDCKATDYTVCWSNIEYVADYSAAMGHILNNMFQGLDLNITIIRVLACQNGRYGENCTDICNENCNSTCGIFDGSCIDGCKGRFVGDRCDAVCSPNCKYGCESNSTCLEEECSPGYTGSDCITECMPGSFGSNCEFNCSLGCLGSSCDNADGSCSCRSGYTGTLCEIECGDGTYGMNCSERCGHCRFDVTCDMIHGQCPAGCSAGYIGIMCIDSCSGGFHGVNCSQNCTNCRNDTCNPVTGVCRLGCNVGWTGDDCEIAVEIKEIEDAGLSARVSIAIVILVLALLAGIMVLGYFIWRRSNKDNYQSHLDKTITIGEKDWKPKIDHTETTSQTASDEMLYKQSDNDQQQISEL